MPGVQAVTRDMFEGAKSEAIRRGANLFLKERYGELRSLKVDAQSKSLSMELMLNGETECVAIDVGAYELVDSQEAPALILREIKVSRPWMNELARAFGEGTPIRIPRDYAAIVKMVLL
jgi:hypothetical protein